MNMLELIARVDRAREEVELLSAYVETMRTAEDEDGVEYILRRARGGLDSAVTDLRGTANELRGMQ